MEIHNELLPETGSWPNQTYGELGTLAQEDGKAQCHICGRLFGHLGNHIVRGHKMSCAEYRAYFGLSRRYPLAGEHYLSTKTDNIKNYCQRGVATILALTPEERSKIRKTRSARLSTTIKNSAYQQQPDVKKRLVERLSSPEIREKSATTQRKTCRSLEFKEKMEQIRISMPEDKRKLMLEKRSASMKATNASPHSEESRKKRADGIRKYWADPKNREKHAEAMKLKWEDPLFKEKQLVAFTAREFTQSASPGARAKISEARRRYFEDPKNRQHFSDMAKQSGFGKKGKGSSSTDGA